MNVGEELETAIWLDGKETEEDLRRFVEVEVPRFYQQAQHQTGLVFGLVEWATKRPGEDRVPPVPDHISGPDVRLLIANAQAVDYVPDDAPLQPWFLELDPVDLKTLRILTRRLWKKRDASANPTNQQVDNMINKIGPKAAMDALKEAIDSKSIH